jgi:hypothetical protein
MSHKYLNDGSIPSSGYINDDIDDALKNLHIDQKVLPIIDNRNTKNISVSERFIEFFNPTNGIPATSTSGNFSATNTSVFNFFVNPDSSTCIDLANSYFVAEFSITPYTDPGSHLMSQNFSVGNFASMSMISNIETNISNVNCSDTTSFQGSYSYTSFAKTLLTRPREEQTYMTPPSNPIFGNGASGTAYGDSNYTQLSISHSSDSASSEYISLGVPNQTVDNFIVVPDQPPYTNPNNYIKNNNAVFFKDLMWKTTGSTYGYDQAIYLQNAALSDIVSTYTALTDNNGDTQYPLGENPFAYQGAEIIIFPQDGIWRSQSGYLPTSIQMNIMLTLKGFQSWFLIDSALIFGW